MKIGNSTTRHIIQTLEPREISVRASDERYKNSQRKNIYNNKITTGKTRNHSNTNQEKTVGKLWHVLTDKYCTALKIKELH